ncbi:AsmA-like C-terminal region-containing protein [Roseicyclus persicicus]|uniref:AsmA family protein n=1 Tax=Roseicyclus persicicus TaxID=2650661 RepID=A0A7X6GZX2_9RHOB|nr:AsmA-like C-terminal region-containing protein [Roseibacterium persicicum]NKX44212.1 AsmA family protein [Roseibacterium persicicum]
MRWIIRIVGVVVLVAALGLVALVVMPTERIAALAADRLGQALGREVSLSGEVRPTLWPALGVRAEGLRVGNPDWVAEGPLIAAEALSIRVPWSAALSGAVQIDEVTLIAPEITLVRAADGRVSWAMGGNAAAPAADGGAGGGAAPAIGITAAQIRDGALTYLDAGTGEALRISGLDAELSLPTGGPATLSGRAVVNGTALGLEAEVAALPALLDGALSAVTAALDWPGGTARFDGQLGLAPALDGTIAVDTTDPGPLLALLGAAMPDLPQGYGRDRIALTGRATLTSEGSAHLRDGRLRLDDTDLALALDVTPGAERPLIRGTVTGTRLALPDSGGSAGGAPAAATPGWSRAPIDVSGLFAADAEVALAVAELQGAGVTVGPVDLRATLTRGRLVLDIDRVGAYGGTLTGQFVVNGRGGLSVGGDLLLAGVQLAPLLTDLADYDRLEGTGSASLQFLGVGNDMSTIMDGLSGEGDLALGAGAIRGLDLAGMIRTLDTSYQGEGARTVYDQVSGNFTIADGILRNDDLFLDAPWGEVRGAGSVDLGAQTLDYRLIPGVITGAEGAAIRVPILVRGSWADPSIRPDLEYLAEQNLAEERARLEAEAQARLDAEAARLENEARTRANELLGTQFDAGTTGDAARDEIERRLREEAEQQLLRLLGQGN